MDKVSRRHFLNTGAVFFCSVAAANAWPFGKDGKGKGGASGPDDIRGHIFKGDAPEEPGPFSREGQYYTKVLGDKTACGICPHRCVLSPGDRSVCRSRVNIGGKLYSLAYGNACAANVDPIEKKPLFHFRPGTKAFSIATTGCNFRCLNCQNWEISQAKPHEVRNIKLFPEAVVAEARKRGCLSIAYTYSEPITFYEYMTETGRLAKEASIYNVLVSAGYINREPLLKLCRVIDGANINLKSFDDAIYRMLNGGRLEPVLNTFKTLHEQQVHFELTNLVVPGYTDDVEMFKRMCGWILANLGPDHPMHLLRFFPRYKLDRLPPTPVDTLTAFRKTALKEGIHYVYVGNVPGHEGNHTYCHQCGRLLVERHGYFVNFDRLSGNRCSYCQAVIPGRWTDAPGNI